jgi:hypothetical protein
LHKTGFSAVHVLVVLKDNMNLAGKTQFLVEYLMKVKHI